MAAIDIVFFVLFTLVVIHSALRGFALEITGIAWFLGGIFFSVAFFREGAAYIRTFGLDKTGYLPEAIAFLILFLIAFLFINIFGAMLKEVIERANLVTLDRILGILFGFIKGIVIIAFIVIIIRIQPLFNGELFLNGSIIAKLLMPITLRGYGFFENIFV
ncbi:MAG: hypothetical protein Pg6A_06080 [Termitinemataceae bacterium]|nr:MAG: hypothetical protein Pg6A_06080 [Termitinemataceae bacterium]